MRIGSRHQRSSASPALVGRSSTSEQRRRSRRAGRLAHPHLGHDAVGGCARRGAPSSSPRGRRASGRRRPASPAAHADVEHHARHRRHAARRRRRRRPGSDEAGHDVERRPCRRGLHVAGGRRRAVTCVRACAGRRSRRRSRVRRPPVDAGDAAVAVADARTSRRAARGSARRSCSVAVRRARRCCGGSRALRQPARDAGEHAGLAPGCRPAATAPPATATERSSSSVEVERRRPGRRAR